MTHKQARRRKQRNTTAFSMPKIRASLLVTPLVVIGIVVATFHLSSSALDRPIHSIEINGPFQRVTALQIEEAISDELDSGFVSADLAEVQQRIVALPWHCHRNGRI